MTHTPKQKPAEKTTLHPRNAHRERYDFAALVKSSTGLKRFVQVNPHGDKTIDFSNPEAVIALNRALLVHFYGITQWDIPQGYLCPPIPGRADYIHYLADLLAENNDGQIPLGPKVHVLDVGVGANCIYPIIGNGVYGWHFVGSDIDEAALASARAIIAANPKLSDAVVCRRQSKSVDIFNGIVKPGEFFDAVVCNPPFHASLQDARAGTTAKWQKLGRQQTQVLNFGGYKTELWYHGGEAVFIARMIDQSSQIPHNCLWFTTLVSKKDNLPTIYRALKKVGAAEVKTINMAQGNKASRIVAWSFLNEAQRQQWRADR